MNAKKIIKLTVSWLILALALAFMYLPLILIVVYSFIDARLVGGKGNFTFELYANLFKNQSLMTAAGNTIVIGLVSSLLATLIGTISAVGIYYMKRGKKAANFVSQITVVNAEIVTAVGFFLLVLFLSNALRLPVKKGLGWLIVCHTMLTVPYVILSVSPRLNQLNPNLFEAGQDLGAGPMRTLITVIFPQLVKGMISGFAIAFTLSLDDFVVTKMNTGNGVATISTYVYDSLKRTLDPSVRALSTIIFVVVLAVLVAMNLVGKRKAKKIKK